MSFDTTLKAAQALDQSDPLGQFRSEFHFPKGERESLYFAGHSLGLMPKKAEDYIQESLEAWKTYGVEGHFKGEYPWLPYHEFVTEGLARLVGAKPNEVVAMNSLTVNLHLMMVSFYRPSPTKHKILIENNTFPSDRYAVISQARSHGFDPTYSIIETKPLDGEMTVTTESILSQIEENKGSLALVMLGNCNYLSGQKFDFEKIVKAAHDAGARVGFNLAHGAGNLKLQLHDWNVDFAVWCSYKYLNSGPGGIAGAFIHEDQMKKPRIQRFEGWWGTNKETRFQMKPDFEAIPTVEAWQLSNPPIFQLASLRASLELFDRAGMERISQKQSQITTYFEELLRAELGEKVQIVTPKERGSMLCLKVKDAPKEKVKNLSEKNVHLDFREPDIIRATPAPLYNSYSDVFHLVQELKSILQ